MINESTEHPTGAQASIIQKAIGDMKAQLSAETLKVGDLVRLLNIHAALQNNDAEEQTVQWVDE